MTGSLGWFSVTGRSGVYTFRWRQSSLPIRRLLEQEEKIRLMALEHGLFCCVLVVNSPYPKSLLICIGVLHFLVALRGLVQGSTGTGRRKRRRPEDGCFHRIH